VLFTADPVTGSFESMIGNYVHGLGEQLVSGEKDAFDFVLRRPNIGKRLSAITTMYGSPKMGIKLLGEVFGQLPEGITIPVWPISRPQLIKAMVPRVKYYLKKNREASKNMSQFIQDTPD